MASVTSHQQVGSDIYKCILKCLEDNDVGINELDLIGYDGTATNTGWKNGVLRNVEFKIQRPLQWFICFLHFNELSLKHLFEYLDGETMAILSSFVFKYNFSVIKQLK
ncbi:hypothetical protein AVEN_213607-1 [Araneus ventricosus]|uniref:DUF4371 domain-containing protein n=1 Tax=Araneus ventricosus TaxID=182803 RepID=A0A4Y2LLY6_ARAVE|nr:hypothetical protein AVEN_213607-1 [Araneus ventricosus]